MAPFSNGSPGRGRLVGGLVWEFATCKELSYKLAFFFQAWGLGGQIPCAAISKHLPTARGTLYNCTATSCDIPEDSGMCTVLDCTSTGVITADFPRRPLPGFFWVGVSVYRCMGSVYRCISFFSAPFRRRSLFVMTRVRSSAVSHDLGCADLCGTCQE